MEPTNPTNSSGMPYQPPTNNLPSQNAMGDAENKHKKVGPIVILLAVVLILIIAALYFFASSINQQVVPNTESVASNSAAPTAPTAPAETAIPAVTNGADDLQSLQDDLNVSTQGLDNHNF